MFQKVHGFELADNGEIRKLRPEVVDDDPTDIVAAGRIWYNKTEHKLKFSDLDDDGVMVTRMVMDELEVTKQTSAKSKSTEGIELRLDDPVFGSPDGSFGRVWLREDAGRIRFFTDNEGSIVSLAHLQDIVPEYNKWKAYHSVFDSQRSSTTSTGFRTKTTMRLNGMKTGRYRIGWHFVYNFNNTGRDFIGQVDLVKVAPNGQPVDVTTLHYMRQEPKDSGSDQEIPVSGFAVADLDTDSDYYVAFYYRSSSNGRRATVLRVALESWRVE